MAKLYAISSKNRTQAFVHRHELSLPALLAGSNNNSSNTDTTSLVTRYTTTEERLDDNTSYELREPCPTPHGPSDTDGQMRQLESLLDSATALCNDLDELIALHYCFYEAVENTFDRDRDAISKKMRECNSKTGLSLFPSWLRERDFIVSDAMHALQQSLRQMVKDRRSGEVEDTC